MDSVVVVYTFTSLLLQDNFSPNILNRSGFTALLTCDDSKHSLFKVEIPKKDGMDSV